MVTWSMQHAAAQAGSVTAHCAAERFTSCLAGKLPTMEIVFLLERVHVEANKCIAFRSVYGMPIAGEQPTAVVKKIPLFWRRSDVPQARL